MTRPARITSLATLRAIWRVLLGSLALYAILPWIAPFGGPASPVDELLLALIAVAMLTGIGTLVAREVLLARPIRAGELHVSTPEGVERLQRILIPLWALCESVGLYGLILYRLSGETRYLYLFLMASAGLFFAQRPGRPPLG